MLIAHCIESPGTVRKANITFLSKEKEKQFCHCCEKWCQWLGMAHSICEMVQWRRDIKATQNEWTLVRLKEYLFIFLFFSSVPFGFILFYALKHLPWRLLLFIWNVVAEKYLLVFLLFPVFFTCFFFVYLVNRFKNYATNSAVSCLMI